MGVCAALWQAHVSMVSIPHRVCQSAHPAALLPLDLHKDVLTSGSSHVSPRNYASVLWIVACVDGQPLLWSVLRCGVVLHAVRRRAAAAAPRRHQVPTPPPAAMTAAVRPPVRLGFFFKLQELAVSAPPSVPCAPCRYIQAAGACCVLALPSVPGASECRCWTWVVCKSGSPAAGGPPAVADLKRRRDYEERRGEQHTPHPHLFCVPSCSASLLQPASMVTRGAPVHQHVPLHGHELS